MNVDNAFVQVHRRFYESGHLETWLKRQLQVNGRRSFVAHES
jgi:hypothetical protein